MNKERLTKIRNRVTEDVDYEDGEWLISELERMYEEIEKTKEEKAEIKRLYFNIAKQYDELLQKVHDDK